MTDKYPDEGGLVLKMHRSNFPKALSTMYMLQAREIIRRCVAGYDISTATAKSMPITIPDRLSIKPADAIVLTTDFVRSLKDDIRFLKDVKHLREVDDKRSSGNAKQFANSSAMRRAARRQLKRITREESEAEAARVAAAEAELREAGKMAMTPHNETPTKSLFASVHYLIAHFALELPEATCALSGCRLLPPDPCKAQRYLDDKQHARHPVRVACGHWFHLRPLHHHLSCPPFCKPCPHCGQRLYHPRWPSDDKKLEKAWAAKQAKQRELGDVTDMLELGDEFAVHDAAAALEAEDDGMHDSDSEEWTVEAAAASPAAAAAAAASGSIP